MEWIGITIALASSSLASLGVNLQALGLKKEETVEEGHLVSAITPQESNDELSTDIDHAEHPETKMEKNKVWIIGFTLYVVFETFGSVFALAFISPVILAPLGASGLVFNVLWSRSLLGTKTSYLDGIGTGFIGIGTGLVSWFGSYLPDGGKTVDDLISHLSHPSVISYFLVQLSFMVIVFLAIKYFEIGFKFFKFARSLIVSSPEYRSPTSLVSENSLR
jgi:PPE-repeat protein